MKALFLLLLLTVVANELHAQTVAFRAHGSVTLNNLSVTPGAVGSMTKTQLCDKTFHTGTVRNVTESTKHKVCAEYGIKKIDCNGKNYEIDHLISLELGGANDIKNLWPQAYLPKPGAKEKDVVENALHAQVCSGKISLSDAQSKISNDWYAVYLQLNPSR